VAANPFVPGFVRGPNPCDRTREPDDVARRAHNGQNVVLVSHRQCGKSSLNENLGRQASGTLDQTYLDGFIPRMIALLKPESINGVKATISQFGQGLAKSQFVTNIFHRASKGETF
jgi:hypothetical protein